MADIQGHGTNLYYGETTNATTFIGVITSISGPNETADSVEMTDFGSTAAEFQQGLRDPGEMTLDVKYHTTYSGTLRTIEARANAATNEPYYYRLAFNDHTSTPSTWICRGHITSLGHAIPHDDIIRQSVTIKFTGPSTATGD